MLLGQSNSGIPVAVFGSRIAGIARWITALLLGLFAVTPVIGWAQGGKGNGYQTPNKLVRRKTNIDTQVERLTERLDLTQQQQFTVRTILMHQRDEIAQVWDDETIEPIARTYKLRALQDEAVKQIRVVLTDDQRKKYMTVADHKAADSPTLQNNYNKYVGAH